MTVYILSVVWQFDSGDCGSEVRAFETFEDAMTAMKAEMKSARKDFERWETEETSFSQGDMSWSIWEEGEYCYNHIDITITECEVL